VRSIGIPNWLVTALGDCGFVFAHQADIAKHIAVESKDSGGICGIVAHINGTILFESLGS